MTLAASDLDAAFEACRSETAEWAKTFYLGTLLLPLRKRRAIWAIYVWCRRTDELMDSEEAQSHSVDELASWSDFEIGKSGRLSEPLFLPVGATHYKSISWDKAFNKVGTHLNTLNSPWV